MLQRALGLEHSPRLAIVTAYGRDELRQEALSLGIEHILLKPVAPSTLFDTAIQLMGGQTEESWSRTFLSLFDALFGKDHLTPKCFFRSCVASVLAVSGIWGLMAMTGTLDARFAGAMAWTEALASTPVPANTLPGSKTVVELGQLVEATVEEGSQAPRAKRRA